MLHPGSSCLGRPRRGPFLFAARPRSPCVGRLKGHISHIWRSRGRRPPSGGAFPGLEDQDGTGAGGPRRHRGVEALRKGGQGAWGTSPQRYRTALQLRRAASRFPRGEIADGKEGVQDA
ncbi:hypothetical protein N9L68_05625 [bacterium]|nr:hypothetical protein [bacterium]